MNFVNLRDARDPVEAAVAYCEQGADELVFLDIAATVENRGTRIEWVRKIVDSVTVPFTVGGGIRNIEDMKILFDMGVDKVSINTTAVRAPDLISRASEEFGPGSLVVAVDGLKNPPQRGKPRLEVVVSGGSKPTGLDAVEWAGKVEALGAGEILLTSRDADGTKESFGSAGRLDFPFRRDIDSRSEEVLERKRDTGKRLIYCFKSRQGLYGGENQAGDQYLPARGESAL